MAFARRQLEKRLPQHSVGPLFEVSAAEQLEHRGTGRDWEKLVASLKHLIEGSGRRLIQAACERGLERISEQLLVIISEEREALQRPIEESETRIAVMKQTIADAERSMTGARVSLHGRQQHISDMFVDRHKTFLARVQPQAQPGVRGFTAIDIWLAGSIVSPAHFPRGARIARACHAMAEARAGESRKRIPACSIAIRRHGKRVSQKTWRMPAFPNWPGCRMLSIRNADFASALNSLFRNTGMSRTPPRRCAGSPTCLSAWRVPGR